MPIYKTNRRKDGKQQYRVIINYTDTNGTYKKPQANFQPIFSYLGKWR